MPRYTRDTAWPALLGPASWPAVSLAVPQNTGSASAGMKRASASTQMLGASAARALDRANTTRIATNSFLRSRCDSQAVSGGPNSMTVKANSVTSWPAAEIEIPRSRDSAGSRPTIRYSVVTMTKAAIARIRIEMAAPGWVVSCAARVVVAGWDMNSSSIAGVSMLFDMCGPISGIFSIIRGI